MSKTKQHTHIAVHTIQGHDAKTGAYEVRPGAGYTPGSDEEEKTLMKSGAIRKAKKEDLERLAATEVTKDRDVEEAPAGYAPGTSSAADEPGLTGNENDAGAGSAEPATSSGARTPASGTRGTGGTRGNA